MLVTLLLASCGGTGEVVDSGTPDSTPESVTPDSTPTGGDNVDTKTTITIKVVDILGNPVKNAYLQVCQGDMCFKAPLVTGDDGVGTMSLDLNGEAIKATILKIESDEGYEFDKSEAFYFESGATSLEIEVSKKVTYKVNCKTSSGAAVEGVKIQLFNAENDRLSKAVDTNADGVAVFENVTPLAYYVKVLDTENAYTVVTESDEGKFSFGDAYEIDIVLDLVPTAY